MDWLIIGGNGQLGRTFRDVLTARNISFNFSTSETLDITNKDAVLSFVLMNKPKVIVNCAAWTAVDAAEDNIEQAFKVNCDGARFVAQAAKLSNARHVFVSTDYVFPGISDQPYKTQDATEPVSVYGNSKLCGENAVIEEHPLQSYVVRTAWLYSQYGNNFVKTMVRKALENQPVRVVNDQHGQPTHAKGLANYIIDLIEENAPPGIYHGTSSGNTTWHGLTTEIFSLLQKDLALVSAVPSTEYPTRAIRPRYSVLGHSETSRVGVREIQDWRIALQENLNEILLVTKDEMK